MEFSNFEPKLKSMKVKELQDFLRPYGAQTTGKKEDSLRRVSNSMYKPNTFFKKVVESVTIVTFDRTKKIYLKNDCRDYLSFANLIS